MNRINYLINPLIGMAAGAFEHLIAKQTPRFCPASTSGLANYLCLRSSAFFHPQNLQALIAPIASVKNLIVGVIQPFLPGLTIAASNTDQVYQLLKKAYNIPALKVQLDKSDVNLYLNSCQPYLRIK